MGATIGTFISLALGDVGVMNIIFVKKLKMDLLYYYKNLFKGIIVCILFTIILGFGFKSFIPFGWGWFIIKSAIMVFAYGFMMFRFGLNDYEKSLFYSILNKIKRGNKKNEHVQ